jgi:hypothetical protein
LDAGGCVTVIEGSASGDWFVVYEEDDLWAAVQVFCRQARHDHVVDRVLVESRRGLFEAKAPRRWLWKLLQNARDFPDAGKVIRRGETLMRRDTSIPSSFICRTSKSIGNCGQWRLWASRSPDHDGSFANQSPRPRINANSNGTAQGTQIDGRQRKPAKAPPR